MPDSINKLSIHDVIWLAGLLEGEGTFVLQSRTAPYIKVSMTDKDVIERVATMWNTTVRKATWGPKATKQQYVTNLHGQKRTAQLLRRLLPHMGQRRSQRITKMIAALRRRQLGTVDETQRRLLALGILDRYNISQAELARVTKISPSKIHHWVAWRKSGMPEPRPNHWDWSY